MVNRWGLGDTDLVLGLAEHIAVSNSLVGVDRGHSLTKSADTCGRGTLV